LFLHLRSCSCEGWRDAALQFHVKLSRHPSFIPHPSSFPIMIPYSTPSRTYRRMNQVNSSIREAYERRGLSGQGRERKRKRERELKQGTSRGNRVLPTRQSNCCPTRTCPQQNNGGWPTIMFTTHIFLVASSHTNAPTSTYISLSRFASAFRLVAKRRLSLSRRGGCEKYAF
jgi:hypothetical protein